MSKQRSTSEDQETSSLEQVLDCEEHTVAEHAQIEVKYCQGILSIAVAMHILCVCLLIACRVHEPCIKGPV